MGIGHFAKARSTEKERAWSGLAWHWSSAPHRACACPRWSRGAPAVAQGVNPASAGARTCSKPVP